MKLVWDEPESRTLRAFLGDAVLLSCELAVTELARAVRRAAALDASPLGLLLARAGEVLEAVALMPLERPLLVAAGVLTDGHLRALDAIHIAAATELSPHDGFVSLDERQSASARLVGLRTYAPQAETVNRVVLSTRPIRPVPAADLAQLHDWHLMTQPSGRISRGALSKEP
ncbi:MAG: type II toxin-antitoxin system VapC family toxin [Actinomycetota bacterium]